VLRELPTAHVGSRKRAYHLICHADDARADFAGRSSSRSPIVMIDVRRPPKPNASRAHGTALGSNAVMIEITWREVS
jgi:hypothetical protein